VRFDIHNWRWAGLPVFLRAGKRLARRATEIVVHFKRPPLELFETVECEGDRCNLSQTNSNRLIFRIQPREGIALRFSAKRPVMGMAVEDVEMDFSYSTTWRRELPEAYERLLLDVMRGDATLFTRADEIEAAWRVVDPIRRLWQDAGRYPLHPYPAGTWGPAAAAALLAPLGARWHSEN